MDIVSYLLELIETQKIIGIKGLGTLYKKKIPGRYDSETHSFLPPRYEITFTTEIKEDQILANFIAENRNISIESANYYLAEFAENIHAQLADHQQADFSPLGKLKLINDEIVLENLNATAFNSAFYGLPSVLNHQNKATNSDEVDGDLKAENSDPNNLHSPEKIEEVKDTESANQSVDKTVDESLTETKDSDLDNQPVYDQTTAVNHIQELNENEERVDLKPETLPEEVEEQKHIAKNDDQSNEVTSDGTGISDPLWKPALINRFEYKDEDEERRTKNRWLRITLRTIFALVMVFMISGVVIYAFYPNLYYTLKEKFSGEPVIQRQPIEVLDTSTTQKIDSPKSDTSNKTVVINSVPKDTVNIPKPNNNTTTYEIIGGAMKTQKKVDQIISNFAKRGITAKKLESMPGRLIKISLGTFTDYNVAKKFQDSLKIKLKNPELYIQTIKPKN